METARTFTNRLADLLARERAALGDFLIALAAFDRQRLWVELGYASLFDFLTRELGLSKASASFRKKASELIQQYPETLGPIRDGRLCLSSVFELAKVLTPDNRDAVLPRFFQLSKREAKVVAASLRPVDAPPQRAMVTTLRIPVATTPGAAPVAVQPASEGAVSLSVVCPAKLPSPNVAAQPEPAPAAPPTPRPTVEPLTANVSRFHVTVSRRFLEKLEAATAALSHSHPGARAEEILEAGLDLLLDRAAKRRGLVKNPRPTPRPSSNPDYVPAQIRRAVWKRDGGRCQWPLASGGVCGSTRRVELDHRLARALGGPPTVGNLRCLCGVHNGVAAREVFGDAWMDRFTRNPRAYAGGEPPVTPTISPDT